MQYSVMSQAVIKFKEKNLNWNTLNSVAFFFYNDDYSTDVLRAHKGRLVHVLLDVHIDESNFSF